MVNPGPGRLCRLRKGAGSERRLLQQSDCPLHLVETIRRLRVEGGEEATRLADSVRARAETAICCLVICHSRSYSVYIILYNMYIVGGIEREASEGAGRVAETLLPKMSILHGYSCTLRGGWKTLLSRRFAIS